jgi:transcriptional regulator with XRE-family HTH domain
MARSAVARGGRDAAGRGQARPGFATRRTRGPGRALAGLSVDYLVRLEQGRATNPSPQVLGAIARALRLTTQERDHLYRLARAAIPAIGDVPRYVTPGIQRIIDRLSDTPVGVFSAAWDLITWNPLWAALRGDPSGFSGREANLAWSFFLAEDSGVVGSDHDRSAFECDIVADLRNASGRYPGDRALAALIDELLASSPRFAAIWADAQVAPHLAGKKTIQTSLVGPITLDCDVLTTPGSDLRVVVYTAEPGTPDHDRLNLLRVAGLQSFSSSTS